MSSARGATGAVKPKLHNVNSIFAGKNQNAVKAPGIGKHGGLQSLGKATAVVRRMPPPATLPSLRAESQGQDPNIALVPQGGTGWAKGDISTTNGILTESQSTVKSNVLSSTTTTLSTLNTSAVHTTDLRPKWAKQPSVGGDIQTLGAQVNTNAATASSKDFPSLAAAAATSTGGKQTSNALTESLKPQKSGSWRGGGSSTLSKTDSEESQVTNAQQCIGLSYNSVPVSARNMERQLPSRYYDTTAVPPRPPTGSFQVPKLQQITSSQPIRSVAGAAKSESAQSMDAGVVTSASSTSSQFPANVAVPPPNYSQPPPNFVPMQTESKQCLTSYTPHSESSYMSNLVRDGNQIQQKSGLDGEGYGSRRPGESNIGETPQGFGPNDDRNSTQIRKEIYVNRGVGFDELSSRKSEDWQSSTYGCAEKKSDPRKWRNVGEVRGQDHELYSGDYYQNGYARIQDEEFGRRQNIEREAAIERSRQKRRMISQSSAMSESENSSPNVYGSVRMMTAFENVNHSDWDEPPRDSATQQKPDDVMQKAYNTHLKQSHNQRWSVAAGNYESKRTPRREEADSYPKPEYRMLKRPDSKESADISQKFSQMAINSDMIEGDEDDELQLTKLSRPAAKIIKRVAPSNGSQKLEIADDNHTSASQAIISSSQKSLSSKGNDRRFNDTRNQTQKNKDQVERNEMDSDEWSNSKHKMINCYSSPSRLNATQQEKMMDSIALQSNVHSGNLTGIPLPPTDNVWEKRAEERESAERERAAQNDAVNQIRFQRHFPAVGDEQEMTKTLGDERKEEPVASGRAKSAQIKSEQNRGRRNGNKVRSRESRKWIDRKYLDSFGDKNDRYEKEYNEDCDTNGLFRGQREFVNSRVHRSGRGSSLISSRGGTHGHARAGFFGGRRGASVPHQCDGDQNPRPLNHYNEKYSQRHVRKGELQVGEEDNFSNMGEFHVEDAYKATQQQRDTDMKERVVESEDAASNGIENQAMERQNPQSSRHSSSRRNVQQLYEPRKRHEYGRSARRGGRLASSGKADLEQGDNCAAAILNRKMSEKSRRNKAFDGSNEVADDENIRSSKRGDSYRRGGSHGGVHFTRRRRHTPSRRSNIADVQGTNETGADRGIQMKSPVTSDGHEEWETASESSDIGDREAVQRRSNVPTKYSSSRRIMRSNNGQKRDNNPAEVSNRSTTNSKNVKPASTTSHVAARSAPPIKEEEVLTTAELPRRDTCKDGLAGVDINNAGVVIIDDRPDGHAEDANENNDDFEEVLSKKRKKLRQQQINEQVEAEERRKLKEKEKIERKKARIQVKRIEKRTGKGERVSTPVVSVDGGGAHILKNSLITPNNITVKRDTVQTMARQTSLIHQNTLNTTVWNSSIVREQSMRASSPVESRTVIPSPIARPTPKSNSVSVANVGAKNDVGMWNRSCDEKVSEALAPVKKSSVEFTSNFNNTNSRNESGNYEFAFDPSLQENLQTGSQGSPSKSVLHEGDGCLVSKKNDIICLPANTLETNDDEQLKQKLDKVKDFWPGQQHFSGNLLVSASGKGSIPILMNDKSGPNVSASSLAHGPNVAKVRPQPQTSEQSVLTVAASMKESVSSIPSVPSLHPQSPIACLPPGAYLQSLSQVPPPPAPFHYSIMFGESYSNKTSASLQALFGTGIPNQSQATRSRPGSFIEQSQVFIHPPPSGGLTSNLNLSNSNPQMELLTGISAQSALSSQQSRSTSVLSHLPSILNANGKMPHMAAPPPPHPHQMPPPLHPPHSFMAPPPDFVSLQGTNLGAVGSQRNIDIANQSSNALSRGNIGVLGQIPPPSLQQSMNFSQQSQIVYPVSAAAAAFSHAPPLHPPPPQMRYPAVSQLTSNDASSMMTVWTRPSSVPFKYASSTTNALNRPIIPRSQHFDRWGIPVSVPPQYHSSQIFTQQVGKESSDMIHANVERFRTHMNATRGQTPEDTLRATSSVSSLSASGAENVDGGSQKKKSAKV